jgi:hypothetical protein
MTTATAGIARTIAETNKLTAALGRASAAASRIGVGGVGGGGARPTRFRPAAGGHGGGIHFGGLSAGIGGAHARVGGSALTAGIGALGYGVYEAAELEDAVLRAMITADVAPGRRTEYGSKLRNIIRDSTTATGMPIGDITDASLTIIRQFAGMDIAGRLRIMPQLLSASAAEARLKGHGTSANEAAESLTGLAHMTKSYRPEQIAELAPMFAYLSATSPLKLKQIEGAAGYGVPFLQSGLNMDPFEVLLSQTALQRAGILNTKSGTWVRELAKRAMPGTSLMSKVAFKKHEEALHELGLIDSHNKPTWFENGKPSLVKMLDIAGEHAEKIPLARRAGLEQSLFGTQGAGAFAVLADPKMREQVKAMKGEMATFKAGLKASPFGEQYAESPVQQARIAFADLQRVLMDLGTIALPPVVDLLKRFDTGLKGLHSIIPGSEMPAAGAGALVGGGLGLFGGPLTGLLGAATGGVVGGLIDWLKGAPGAQSGASKEPVQMNGVLTLNGDVFARYVGMTVNDWAQKAPTQPGHYDPTRVPSVFDAAHAFP